MGVGKYFKQKLIAIHKWNQKRWLIIPLITSTIGVWFSLILTYLGINLHLITVINNTRILTWQGWIFTGLVVLVSTIFVIAQRVYEYEELNNGKDKAELVLLNVMNSASNRINPRILDNNSLILLFSQFFICWFSIVIFQKGHVA